jgi:metal-responsive CopG/Arc/MetJ family transcriptional regulator
VERLSVRLSDQLFRELDALALERGVTRTGLVRQLLEAGLRGRDSIRPLRAAGGGTARAAG